MQQKFGGLNINQGIMDDHIFHVELDQVKIESANKRIAEKPRSASGTLITFDKLQK